MGWNTDQTPINYLKRRVIYYKKQKAKVKGLLSRPFTEFKKNRYGSKAKFKKVVDDKIYFINDMIGKFNAAIEILEQNN